MALLVGAGPLTATPLILYAAGARLLNYATIGILQYIVPTLIFLSAVFLFGEPFGLWQLVAFGFIWSALVVYSSRCLAAREGDGRHAHDGAVSAALPVGSSMTWIAAGQENAII